MNDGFVNRASLPGAPTGPLAGLRFAVKDLLDVAGTQSLWGTPDRAAEAPVMTTTAAALRPLLAAGASIIGKTITDELACGMFGQNPWDGTPRNPAAPLSVPGGSSAGSASAVAAGLCDFAIGTDTGGSIRVPASFCGLYGIRTSHGRIATSGVMPMAPSFDTVGWLARDATTLRRVGEAYFGPIPPALPPRFLVADDAFKLAVPGVYEALVQPVADWSVLVNGPEVGQLFVDVYQGGVDLWRDTFVPLQLGELWSTLGHWATRPGRRLSPAVAKRFRRAEMVTDAQIAAAWPVRETLAAGLSSLLADGSILALPTLHELIPGTDADEHVQDIYREAAIRLTCVASLCRLPAVSVPLGRSADRPHLPVGVTLIAGPMRDAQLLAAVEALTTGRG